MATTAHSLARLKERRHLKNPRSAEKNIEMAINRGRRAKDYSSWEKSYLERIARGKCEAIAYNQFCYIMNAYNECITLFPLPAYFGRKKPYCGKEWIRSS